MTRNNVNSGNNQGQRPDPDGAYNPQVSSNHNALNLGDRRGAYAVNGQEAEHRTAGSITPHPYKQSLASLVQYTREEPIIDAKVTLANPHLSRQNDGGDTQPSTGAKPLQPPISAMSMVLSDQKNAFDKNRKINPRLLQEAKEEGRGAVYNNPDSSKKNSNKTAEKQPNKPAWAANVYNPSTGLGGHGVGK